MEYLKTKFFFLHTDVSVKDLERGVRSGEEEERNKDMLVREIKLGKNRRVKQRKRQAHHRAIENDCKTIVRTWKRQH